MKVYATEELDLTPKQLAKAISECTNDEFADMWLKLNEILQKNKIRDSKVDGWSKAMSPQHGSNRLNLLNEICVHAQSMNYKEMRT